VTLGDTLADAGLADEKALRALVAAWRALIDLIKPDLVIADYAPAAALAARGRIPLALVGTGFTLPPDSMAAFPLLHPFAPVRWPEPQLLAAVNAVTNEFALTPLQHLPQLFSGDAKWVHTFPLLDPYADRRQSPAHGPTLQSMPKARRADAQDILVYFSSWPDLEPTLLRVLAPAAQHARIFAPFLPREEKRHLADLGMRIEDRPFDIAEDLATARLVLHFGSAGFAGDALIAGVPQAICPIDVEKQLTGDALEKAGVGKKLSVYAPDITLTEETVTTLLTDTVMADQARAQAETLRARYRGLDPLSDFVSSCLALLG
jgi:UDP:flavonoid glycosyltransferase YjiC (YdhE family)